MKRKSKSLLLLKWGTRFLLIFALLGIIDAGYLTYEHINQISPASCQSSTFIDCRTVLGSKYSEIFNIPLALIGVFYYTGIALLSIFILKSKKYIFELSIIFLTFIGLVFSLYFMYLQIFILKSICLYCTLSAVNSLILFILANLLFPRERKRLAVYTTHFLYKTMRPILFLTESESIHNLMTNFGNLLGKMQAIKPIFNFLYKYENKKLEQNILKIHFKNPVGLAAGFDYEAKLTQITPHIGFGFQTVGTITNKPYEGNPPPRLGRLVKSKSLLVNKGFKSPGVKRIIKRLTGKKFEIPIGISVGRTNSKRLKTQKQSTIDIIKTLKLLEKSKLNHAYYELNISCPNLNGNITFYSLEKLDYLLSEVDKLKIKRPIFIKMPIRFGNKKTLRMLKIISKHCPKGVIVGNLQTNKKHKTLNPDEVRKFKKGYYSGKPTWKDSNRLIELTYKNFKKRFIIIGCGGVFNGQDAYQKIKLGANLIQFITGLIFEGPQLASQINLELTELLERDGYKNISQAVGAKFQPH